MTEPRQENALERLVPEDFESIAEMEARRVPGARASRTATTA